MTERPRSLFVTGIPRSGTTLACALLDDLEDAVCLGEPSELFDLMGRSRTSDEYVAGCLDYVARTREALAAGLSARDRRLEDGAPVTNYVGSAGAEGRRELNVEEHDFRRSLTSGGLVAVKHNAPFMAVLPELKRRDVPICAIVRHPVAAIASWLSVDLPVSRGSLPMARKFWPECEASLAGTSGLVRLAALYDVLCRRLVECDVPVLKYEDLAADPEIIPRLAGRRFRNRPDYVNSRPADRGDSATRSDIVSAVRDVGDWVYRFYPDVS